jgi:hypothetical protein
MDKLKKNKEVNIVAKEYGGDYVWIVESVDA